MDLDDPLSLFQSGGAMNEGKDALAPRPRSQRNHWWQRRRQPPFPVVSLHGGTAFTGTEGGMRPVAMTPQILRDTTTSKSFGTSHSVLLQKH